jgi:hypothetical protein
MAGRGADQGRKAEIHGIEADVCSGEEQTFGAGGQSSGETAMSATVDRYLLIESGDKNNGISGE